MSSKIADGSKRVNGSAFRGVCKFWNAVKGIGFITDADGQDLFVAQQDLVTGDSGFRALVENQRVECVFTVTEDGKTLGKNVTGPNGAYLPSFKDMYTAKKAIEAAKSPDPNKTIASVKWFDAAKNFGFLVPEGGGEDVFFHFSSCLNSVVPEAGDKVECLVKNDQSGKRVASRIKNKSRSARLTTAARPGGKVPQPAGHALAPMFASYPAYGYEAPLSFPGYQYGYEAPAQFPGNVRMTGMVKFYDNSKGYGFIVPERGGPDVHVHSTNVVGGTLNKGDTVEYEEQIYKGKAQAKKVERRSGAKKRAPPKAPNGHAVGAYEYDAWNGNYGYDMNAKRSRVAYGEMGDY